MRDSIVSMIRLREERFDLRIPAGARSLLQNVQAGSGVHLASFYIATGILSRE
jgi:hypothetical protein